MKTIKRIARWLVWCLNYNPDVGHHPYYYGEAHSNENHYFRGFPGAWSQRVRHGWTPHLQNQISFQFEIEGSEPICMAFIESMHESTLMMQ